VLDPTILRISQPAARNAEGYRVLARARNSKFQSRKSRAGYFLSSRSLDPKIRPRFRHPPSAATTPDSKREKKAANGSRNGRQGEDFSAAEFSDAARSYVRFPAHRGRGGGGGRKGMGGIASTARFEQCALRRGRRARLAHPRTRIRMQT